MKGRNRPRLLAPLTAFTLLAAAPLPAQFALEWFTFDGGGGASAGRGYSIHATIGQPDAGMASGGRFTLRGGFWSPWAATPESAPSIRIEQHGTSVLLAWPNPSTGYQLQESPSLTVPGWTDVTAPPAVVGGEKQVSQTTSPGGRFYRLRQP